MTGLFDKGITSVHPEYLALRDQSRHADLRRHCSQLWGTFEPFADADFLAEFALHPHQRYWEMYLGVRLIELGFQLRPRASADGPDLLLILDNRNVWIEATVPGEGAGIDSVPTLEEHSGFMPIPEDKIILRFTNSISEKKQRLDHYLDAGIVAAADAYIIAISGGRIQMLMFNGPMPAIIKSVYPIGDHQVIVDANKGEVIEQRLAIRRAIEKASGSLVSTQSFIDPSFSAVSGLLYSDVALTNQPKDQTQEFLFIHNSVAAAPMDNGWLGIGRDCWVEQGRLRIDPN